MEKATGLTIEKIAVINSNILFLIYDHSALHLTLQDQKASAILASHGYPPDISPEEKIRYLSQRMSQDAFPHEIGIFLGYPPEDVIAYTENAGRNSTCCRYWKAYGNAEKAREIWAQIDEAQSYAVDVLRNFPPIHIAANMLKAQ